MLLLKLTERSRAFCGSPYAVCAWGNGHRAGTFGTSAEHAAVFGVSLHSRDLELSGWAARREPHHNQT